MAAPLLSNLKILDFTTLLPGPYATMILADLGADVLRIESSKRFDPIRVMPPFVDEKGSLSCGPCLFENYLSLSGIMSYSGRKDTGPNLMGIQIADVGSGSYNAIVSILAAFICRAGSGEGQYIDISMTDGLFSYQAMSAIMELSGMQSVGYETEMLNGGSLYDFYETADGKYISFGGIEPKFFNSFCDVLGLDDMKSKGIGQPGNLDIAKKRVSDLIKSKPRDYWVERFKDEDACLEPVLTFSEAIGSDHAKKRDIITEVPAPDGKKLTQIACPIKFSKFKPEYKRCGCKLGEDTLLIMKSLGFSDSEIESIKEKGYSVTLLFFLNAHYTAQISCTRYNVTAIAALTQ